MKTFALALVIVVSLASVATAEQFMAIITKIEGKTITFKRGYDGYKNESADVAANAVIAKGDAKFEIKDSKKKGAGTPVLRVTAGDAIKGGLDNEIFTKIGKKGEKETGAQLTINEQGQITQILVLVPVTK
ncbi:MAG TPA: hypothetical protein VE988_20880 [Gemmataceae bacterium]|nr:hypothetical protein [Gemmataceae bacterium]